jgi:hypothetical protein
MALAACASESKPTPDQTELSTATPFQPVEPTATPTPEPVPEVFTGVLLGTDYDPQYPERNSFGIRTDVFIIVSMVTWPDEWEMPARLVMVALPRDLYLPIACAEVELPGEYAMEQDLDTVPREAFDRINAAWYRGGAECVRETVRYNFGVEVDGPVLTTTMPGFIAATDALGGLDIVPGQDYTDFCGTYNGTDGQGGDWRTWKAGRLYHMMGNELLCYVRGRQVSIGDLDRNRRELEVIREMKEQWHPSQLLGKLSLGDYLDLYTWAGQYVLWDAPGRTLADNIWRLRELPGADVVTASLGTDFTDFWTTPGGASVVVPAFNMELYGTEFDQADALMHWFGCTLWAC